MIEMLQHRSPRELEEIIKKSVVGQDEGVKTIATALSAHLSRLRWNIDCPENLIHKDNLLICGPSGCGKTESIRTVVRELDLPIPVITVAANMVSNSGYKGKTLEDILYSLMNDSKRILKKLPRSVLQKLVTGEIKDNKLSKEQTNEALIKISQTGIIVMDEFDKIATSGVNEYANQYLTMLQGELLKMVEGGKGFAETYPASEIDTTDILFVFSGAFTSLVNPPNTFEKCAIGFNSATENNNKAFSEPDRKRVPSTEDFIKFGFMPELIGRIPLKCRYNALSATTLYKILAKSKISPVNDFKVLFSETGNTLKFEDSALKAIARKAISVGTGARGLRTIMGDFLYPLLYEVDGTVGSMEIVITKSCVTHGDKPAMRKNTESCPAEIFAAVKGFSSTGLKSEKWKNNK